MTDKEIDDMMVQDQEDQPWATGGFRMRVRPEIVLEVAFDSIQKSDRHDSGYALRFPRIKRIRDDKKPRRHRHPREGEGDLRRSESQGRGGVE